ncbi:MAG: ABC transporter ATP-binding protein [Armatimonadaceae bacterium]
MRFSEQRTTEDAPLLTARQVTKRFGAFTALNGVDFAVRRGEIHALLGENGAGKSTLMNILSGLLRPTSGEILFHGQPMRFASPADAERVGIGMVHQHFLLVPTLSVRENLLLGAAREMGGSLSYPTAAAEEQVQTIANRLGWQIPWDAPAGDLPVGTQQRLEILKALRGETHVLIFDEPTAVLTPTETPELFATIRQLAEEGRGIVFISHKLDEVLQLAQRVTVLRRGKVVHWEETAAATAESLAEAMVGQDSEAAELLEQQHRHPGTNGQRSETAPLATETPRLQVEDLRVSATAGSQRPLLSNISFAVSAGEIFGIAGVDGNGQRELADCLSGLLSPDSGSILIAGDAPAANPAAFRQAGVAVVPADRQRRGLALPLSITENITFGVYDKADFRRGPLLLWGSLRKHSQDLIDRFDIRATSPDVAVRSLSGGNQQKVVIARALADNPRVVVAVNPTRGLDVGAIAYVHDALRRARDAGAAVVLISTELTEILTLSDRIAVLFEGRFTGIVPPDIPREELGLLMGGRSQ